MGCLRWLLKGEASQRHSDWDIAFSPVSGSVVCFLFTLCFLAKLSVMWDWDSTQRDNPRGLSANRNYYEKELSSQKWEGRPEPPLRVAWWCSVSMVSWCTNLLWSQRFPGCNPVPWEHGRASEVYWISTAHSDLLQGDQKLGFTLTDPWKLWLTTPFVNIS